MSVANEVVADGPAQLAAAGLVAMTLVVAVQPLLSAPMVAALRRGSLRRDRDLQLPRPLDRPRAHRPRRRLAAFWDQNPWLIPFALAPLLVVHRSLSVPMLEPEARVDPKTGLFNARYFATALADEFGRAERFGRPLALLMADLDLLRDINNSYGHLAGDAVLKGIAEVFRGAAAPLRRAGPLRRRGVQHPPPRDGRRAGASRSPSASAVPSPHGR